MIYVFVSNKGKCLFFVIIVSFDVIGLVLWNYDVWLVWIEFWYIDWMIGFCLNKFDDFVYFFVVVVFFGYVVDLFLEFVFLCK